MINFNGKVNWTEEKWNNFMTKVDTALELVQGLDSYEVEDFEHTVGWIRRRVEVKLELTRLNDGCRMTNRKLNNYYSQIIVDSRLISRYTNINLNPLFNGWWMR
tara:strand:+ start:1206 stop:1517 length:312 start_codon:yes stop_codon:yes gene_type:complete